MGYDLEGSDVGIPNVVVDHGRDKHVDDDIREILLSTLSMALYCL